MIQPGDDMALLIEQLPDTDKAEIQEQLLQFGNQLYQAVLYKVSAQREADKVASLLQLGELYAADRPAKPWQQAQVIALTDAITYLWEMPTTAWLTNTGRSEEEVSPRAAFARVCREYLHMTTTEIGRLMGDRHYSTVMNASTNTHDSLYQTYPDYATSYRLLVAKIDQITESTQP